MATFDSFFNKVLFSGKYRIVRHLLFQLPIFMMSLNAFGAADGRLFDFSRQNVPQWLIMYAYLLTCWYVNIYLLTPRFFFKDKILKFTISTILLSLPFGILKVLSEVFMNYSVHNSLIISSINVASSFLSMILLSVAPTSLLLFRRTALQNLRNRELQAATAQTELKMLKQQINPHFLFNMINNVNVLVRREPAQASALLYRLEDLIRYQFADSRRERVNLLTDIQFLRDFLDLEQVRRTGFTYKIDTDGITDGVEVPPLLFIPFVENAVKHNSDGENGSWVNVSFCLAGGSLTFVCQNSKPAVAAAPAKVGGIGLNNISRRLELLYGHRHTLQIDDENDTFTVRLKIELTMNN